ncbi:helix-turn-helix domain-containing protein [Paenibacillus cisolokensis]|uniref:helix-turn-helix domain-containing protein n=1 Tax=Paenibacillus cisolokensis TaxID=1658519 RepID=UPI003D273603
MELLGKVYTVEETAELLKVDINTVYKWIKEKKLSAIKLGGTTWRIKERDLHYFILQAAEEGRK